MAQINDTFRLEYIDADTVRLIPIQSIKETKMKPSTVLAFAGWGSVFALCWLMLLGIVEKTGTAWAMMIFFFLVALFASVYTPAEKRNVPKINIQKMGDEEIAEIAARYKASTRINANNQEISNWTSTVKKNKDERQ